MAKRTTLVDISKRTGFSLSTVSEILNDKNCRYSPKTRDYIKKIASELNYQPNHTARSLRTQKTFTVGLIIPMLYMELDEIHEICSSKGYTLNIFVTHNNPVRLQQQLQQLQQKNIDGALIITPLPDCELLSKLSNNKYPIVISDVVDNYPDSDTFFVDLPKSFELAFEHLKQFGHRRIGFVSNEIQTPYSLTRKKLWNKGVEEIRSASKNGWFFRLEGMTYPTERSIYNLAYRAAKQFLNIHTKDSPDRPTALITITDRVAIGVIKAFMEAGWRVPQDISVMSTQFVDEGRYHTASISTIDANLVNTHIAAMERLLFRLNKSQNKEQPIKIISEAKLIPGETVGTVT